MEWQQEQTPNGVEESLVRVMTDEQIECLRRQIAAYTVISEQLLQMHNSVPAEQHDDFAGWRPDDFYSDPLSLMATWGCKMIPRQKRWAPTPSQLMELERLYKEGNVAPSKEKIKEITTELSQHGQISEANTYNWFQNRRARSKRKQLPPMPNNAEKVESSKGKKTRHEVV